MNKKILIYLLIVLLLIGIYVYLYHYYIPTKMNMENNSYNKDNITDTSDISDDVEISEEFAEKYSWLNQSKNMEIDTDFSYRSEAKDRDPFQDYKEVSSDMEEMSGEINGGEEIMQDLIDTSIVEKDLEENNPDEENEETNNNDSESESKSLEEIKEGIPFEITGIIGDSRERLLLVKNSNGNSEIMQKEDEIKEYEIIGIGKNYITISYEDKMFDLYLNGREED